MMKSYKFPRKYRVAFTGVFDIDNFGDHLFPIIFEKNLKNIEVFLFSPFESVQGFGLNKKVYPLCDLDKYCKEYQFDAIVVGGGEIIHLFSFQHKNHKNEMIDYPIYETWIIPSIIGQKNNISVIWNNPGCPFEFSGYQKVIADKILKNVSYLSVRNKFSYDVLKEFNSNAILSVDTAFDLPHIFPKNKLNRPINEKYVVFHCNKHIGEAYYQEVLHELKKLSKDYKIVLIQLAVTNDDLEVLRRIKDEGNDNFILLSDKMDIKEIVEYFAYTDLYIGVSFHGAIAAFSYGNKVIGYDFFRNKKTKDLFELMGVLDFYIEDTGKLGEVLDTIDYQCTKKYKKIEKEVRKHFKAIKSFIKNTSSDDNQVLIDYDVKFWSEIIGVMSKERMEKDCLIEKYKSEAQYNLLNWQKCSNELIEMYNKNKALEEEFLKIKDTGDN